MPAHGQTRHNWPAYADGAPREFTKGPDFTCLPVTLANSARNYANKNGLRCTAQVRGASVFIRIWEEGK
jgi:hypothetical protein